MATPLNRITDFIGITNTRANDPVQQPTEKFDLETAGERQTLLEWTIVTRPQLNALVTPKLNRSLVVIGGFVALLLVLMQEFLLIAAIGGLIFLWYALSAAPVEQVTHRITNHGIEFAGQFYFWNELTKFFFTRTGTMDTLCIDTKDRLPGRLFFMIESIHKEKIKEILGRYLTYLEDEPKNFTDRLYERVVSKISLGGQ